MDENQEISKKVEAEDSNTTVEHGVRRPSRNMARRSRGRRQGQLYAMRTRLDPSSEKDVHQINGFALDTDPEYINSHWMERGELQYSVTRRDDGVEPRQIRSSVLRAIRPQMVMDYLEAVVAKQLH